MIKTKGRIHSFQSLGTVDGPGIRYVVFMQGCNLRCGCCHNPDTWDFNSGNEFTADEVFQKAIRFREYFGKDGGITISGGEPLLQADFATELFTLCKNNRINTCLDTSGSILNENVKKLLDVTDRILLDIKYTNDKSYLDHVGCSIDKPLEFLCFADKNNIPVTIRQVIIPTLNDNEDNIVKLRELTKVYKSVDSYELLPFRKICQVKYDDMGIEFPFKDIPTPSKELMDKLNSELNCS